MTIRESVSTDFSAWLEMWQGFLAYHDVELGEDHNRNVWARLQDKTDPLHALVAEQDGRLVGFTHFFFHCSTWSNGGYCYLEDLYVDQTIRSRGVGRALIAAVEETARQKGASKLYWHTYDDNENARALYDKIAKLTGYVHYQVAL